MQTATDARVLGSDDAGPILRIGGGSSRWEMLCDHAGNEVPRRLGNLGLSPHVLGTHIGIDIGIWPVTGLVAKALDAEALGQRYSRLVIDCNRKPGTAASIPEVSDGTAVPGNAGRPDSEARVREIFSPYHNAIAASIERRHPRPLLCSMHSFTRELAGQRRDVDIGVIHGPRAGLADAVLEGLAQSGLRVGRNTPYQIDFAGDYTLPVHGEARGLDYVEIEICQDLIATQDGQARLAAVMARALGEAAQASRS